jgi:UDP-GlcNAc:undecaprenyl-phosphate GlcNAc-1-phosphate transferase
LGLLGASLGFLRFNFHPAKIFMGDTGANFLGFTFAAISLFGQGKTVVFTSLLMPIAALSLPIIDVGHRIIKRTKDKKSLFQSARDHIHHRFMDMGFKQKWVVVEFYLLTAIMGGMGLFLLVQNRLYIYIFSTLFLVFSIIWFKNRR